MLRVLLTFFLALAVVGPAVADDIQLRLHAYTVGETPHEGVLVWDAEDEGPRPAVLIVHQWMGISEHELDVARKLADEGYVAFVADVYGRDRRPTNTQEAGELAAEYRSGGRANLRLSLDAALTQLRTAFPELVDPERIAAIGYCFGGTGVLEMARTNAPVLGVASFHGGLSKGTGPTAEVIKPRVLVLHGEADPLVPPAEVTALMAELNAANADWELVSYGGAVHSFTDRKANSPAARYDAKADARSWERLEDYLEDLFGTDED
jgi:dienelactone hydrolase